MWDPSSLQKEGALQDIEVMASVTKTIGSLAVAYPYLRRVQVAESIATLVAAGKERQVPTGPLIEVLRRCTGWRPQRSTMAVLGGRWTRFIPT